MKLFEIMEKRPESVYLGGGCFAIVSRSCPGCATTGRFVNSTTYTSDYDTTRGLSEITFKDGELYGPHSGEESWLYWGPFKQMTPVDHKALLLKLFVK